MDLSAEGRQQSGQGKALRLPELFQQRTQILLVMLNLTAEQPQGLRQSHEAGEAVCHQYPQRAELRPAQQVSIVDGLQQIPEGEVHGDAFQLFRVLGSEARQFRRLLPLLQQRQPVRFQNFQILQTPAGGSFPRTGTGIGFRRNHPRFRAEGGQLRHVFAVQ